MLTLNNINLNNINIAHGVSLLASNKHNSINNDQKNIFSSDKSNRFNSQNIKNISRNSSIRESSNNSLNKDSLKVPEKCDNLNCNVCPSLILHNTPHVPIINQHNKNIKVPLPSHNVDNKNIVNFQEIVNKNERNLTFNQELRKKSFLDNNNLNKNNIMDLENECGKNDLCFKVYETNKFNYPLKIENNDHNSGYYNNYLTNQKEKNDLDIASMQKG